MSETKVYPKKCPNQTWGYWLNFAWKLISFNSRELQISEWTITKQWVVTGNSINNAMFITINRVIIITMKATVAKMLGSTLRRPLHWNYFLKQPNLTLLASCFLDLLDVDIDGPNCCFQYLRFMDVKLNVKIMLRIIVFVKHAIDELFFREVKIILLTYIKIFLYYYSFKKLITRDSKTVDTI